MKESVSLEMWKAYIEATTVCPDDFAAAAQGMRSFCDVENSAYATLSFSGNTAKCVSICGGADIISIAAVQTLQKRNMLWQWKNVLDAEWTKSVDKSHISLSNTRAGFKKGIYRIKTSFTLTNSRGQTETITVYSSKEKF